MVREKGERATFKEKTELFDRKGHHPIVYLSYSSLCEKYCVDYLSKMGGEGRGG